ncbi:IclR family transcriptional regulator [Agilicoccus flavus]|uniref:IclR family transcriptional regulator n=1 Tax=Agilicoccus flavus TaxID=2775968 RepID=UPI001CF6BD1D|nr:IclR family transcriptional regulator [Agilicoccus flavus]
MVNEPAGRDTSVQSVDRAVSILQVLARHGSARVTDIAAELDVHKSTVSRLLATLEARGLVEQSSARGNYVLGDGVTAIAAGAARRHDLALVSRPVCAELAEAVGETVTVTIPDGDAVLSIGQVMGSAVVTTVNWLGRRSPLHATSSGKLFLAAWPPERSRAVLDGDLPAYTERTMTDPGVLARELDRVRELGYATTSEEQEVGLCAVSAPIRDLDAEVVAALTVSGPSFRVTPEAVEALLPRLLTAAARISERNGYPKPG